MNYSVTFSMTAAQHLDSIGTYIAAAADPMIAERFVNAIADHCLDLEMFPHRGTQRDDLRPGLRTISYRKRVVIAFVVDDQASRVAILGVFYGGQDIDAALPFGDVD